jgi:phosphoribosylaminoimidazole-succinocarboxamide synthase
MQSSRVLTLNDNLPIKTDKPVHSGKVRSVYWLTDNQSQRLIETKGYPVAPGSSLAVMVISDRLSAFDCIWRAEGLDGVPSKGAALNTISHHWFKQFRQHGLANSHILDCPHPLVWIVQRAQPLKIEAIARRFITGSMWRAYAKGERRFCGMQLDDGLKHAQYLPNLLITPSTKGILRGIPDVPEVDDVDVSRELLIKHYRQFGFLEPQDIPHYEMLLIKGFNLISDKLADLGQLLVDTKFEFGYIKNANGDQELIYMDEVGTPDSSRIWSEEAYLQGNIVEQSKEVFRQSLLNYFSESDFLLDKNRMKERIRVSQTIRLPSEFFDQLSMTYQQLAEKITGRPLACSDDLFTEIVDVLAENYQLIE